MKKCHDVHLRSKLHPSTNVAPSAEDRGSAKRAVTPPPAVISNEFDCRGFGSTQFPELRGWRRQGANPIRHKR